MTLSKIEEIKIPDIGDFDAVEVIEIAVSIGDSVQPEDTLITVESDKASIPSNVDARLKSGKTISVETISLNDVVKEYFNSICPSYISIDTEGSEYEILKAFDLDNFRPKVFTIEHNHTENETKIDDLLITNGYVRIFRKLTAFDAWYIQLEDL